MLVELPEWSTNLPFAVSIEVGVGGVGYGESGQDSPFNVSVWRASNTDSTGCLCDASGLASG
jgi:hypothetical protein